MAGIAGVAELRGVGRIGGKALIYFEAVTTLALVLGLVVMNLLKPGEGVNAVAPELSETVAGYVETAQSQSNWHLITDMVPEQHRRGLRRGRRSCRCCSSPSCSAWRSSPSGPPASRSPGASTTSAW